MSDVTLRIFLVVLCGNVAHTRVQERICVPSVFLHMWLLTCLNVSLCVCFGSVSKYVFVCPPNPLACVRPHSCLTLCDSKDYSLPGSSVHGIFQVRILEQVATSFSRGSSQPSDQTRGSCVSCIGKWDFFFCLFFFLTSWATGEAQLVQVSLFGRDVCSVCLLYPCVFWWASEDVMCIVSMDVYFWIDCVCGYEQFPSSQGSLSSQAV